MEVVDLSRPHGSGGVGERGKGRGVELCVCVCVCVCVCLRTCMHARTHAHVWLINAKETHASGEPLCGLIK